MKIGMVSTAHAACGIAEYTEMLGLALKELGHDVMVFSEINPKESLPYALPFKDCWERNLPPTYTQLRDAVKEWNPDVVHWEYEWGLHGPYGVPWDGPVFEMALPRKHFMTWHNVTRDPKEGFYGRLMDRHIVHNQPSRDMLAGIGFPAAIVNHGTRRNTITDTEVAKQKLGLEGKKVLTSFGFLMARKGTHMILNVWEMVKKYCPDAYLLVLGGRHPKGGLAWEYSRLFDRAQELYPDDLKVTGFMGDQDLIDLYLSASDAVIFPHIGGDQVVSASGSVRRVIDHAK